MVADSSLNRFGGHESVGSFVEGLFEIIRTHLIFCYSCSLFSFIEFKNFAFLPNGDCCFNLDEIHYSESIIFQNCSQMSLVYLHVGWFFAFIENLNLQNCLDRILVDFLINQNFPNNTNPILKSSFGFLHQDVSFRGKMKGYFILLEFPPLNWKMWKKCFLLHSIEF